MTDNIISKEQPQGAAASLPETDSGEHIEPLGIGRGIFVNNIHRFGTDAFLLADFSSPKRKEVCVDLGTGCGIIPMLWLSNGCCRSAVGVDISRQACSLARRSAELCGESERFTVAELDLRDISKIGKEKGLEREKFDCVVCNPPYFIENSGYVSPDPQRAAARSECSCCFDDVCDAAVYLLRWGGRMCVCHRPERLADVICSMRSHGIEPKRMRMAYHHAGSKPWLLLVEGRRGGAGSMDILPPLYMTDENGASSAEVEAIYGKYRESRGWSAENADSDKL